MKHLLFESGQVIFAEGEPSDLTYRIRALDLCRELTFRDVGDAERKYGRPYFLPLCVGWLRAAASSASPARRMARQIY